MIDWKADFTKIITDLSCPIVSSTDTEIVFTVKDYQCKLEFGANLVKLSKMGDGKAICAFPKIPPAFVMIKSVITRLLAD